MAGPGSRGAPGEAMTPALEAATWPDPFGVLLAEHAFLRQQFARVIAAADSDGSDGSLDRALGAFSETVDAHQRREDLVLYPVCERLFGGKGGAAAVLRGDHAAIVDQVGALIGESRATGRVSRARLEALQRDVDDHLGKEERVLFPMIAALLSGTEANALARRLRGALVA